MRNNRPRDVNVADLATDVGTTFSHVNQACFVGVRSRNRIVSRVLSTNGFRISFCGILIRELSIQATDCDASIWRFQLDTFINGNSRKGRRAGGCRRMTFARRGPNRFFHAVHSGNPLVSAELPSLGRFHTAPIPRRRNPCANHVWGSARSRKGEACHPGFGRQGICWNPIGPRGISTRPVKRRV